MSTEYVATPREAANNITYHLQEIRRALDTCADAADLACSELDHEPEYASMRRRALVAYAEGMLEVVRVEREAHVARPATGREHDPAI